MAFAERLAPAAGFRNVLVHMYTDIDLEKLYSHLQNDIDNRMYQNRFEFYNWVVLISIFLSFDRNSLTIIV